jgi:uncharacterized protein involved in exopolysaccharide biosynthesis
VLATVWQRRWWIVVPAVVSAAATWGIATFLPQQYESVTTLRVVPQQVPTSFVQATVTQTLPERIASIQVQILSRTRLERVIQEFDLFNSERRTWTMEDVVEQMRRAIAVESSGDANTFRVRFTSQSPRKAQMVAGRLAGLFVDQSMKDREVLAQGTDQFLESAVEEGRRRLDQFDGEIAKYKAANPGRAMPTAMTIENAVLQDTYRALLEKKAESKLAMTLEVRQVGEHFQIIDPARFPERAIGPSRAWLSVMAALGGLAVGLVMVGVSSRKSSS